MKIIYNKYIQILTIKYDKNETVYTNDDYDGYDIYIYGSVPFTALQ